MRRIAILNHFSHTLLVEDINEQELEKKYGGDEQKYIDENYTLEADYSWDWIIDTEYFPEGQSDPVEIEFTEFL